MTPQPARGQAVSEIYTSSVLHLCAGGRWRRSMMACFDYFVPMCWAASQAGSTCSAFSSAEAAIAACQNEWVSGAASPWRSSARSSCAQMRGTPSHAPRDRRASMKSILTSTLSRKKIHNRGSKGAAAAKGAPGPFVASRSSADYAARGASGDPRGRKSGAGTGATNPR